MDKHSKRSASIFRYPVLMAFTLFFAGLFVLDLVTPDRAYSRTGKHHPLPAARPVQRLADG